MKKQINWGLIGCGRIAPKFIGGVNHLQETSVVAVASKNIVKAKRLAYEFDIPNFYDDYEALITNPEVDAIYISNTHNFHKETAMLCLKHKKPVLCEKAFTVNGDEAEEVLNYAKAQGVFIMEAMWTRFLPNIVHVKKLLTEDTIGEIRFLQGSFGFSAPNNPQDRLLNVNLAGGSLLDVGVYLVSLAYFILDKDPVDIKSSAIIGKTGVDEQATMHFTYDNGEMALFNSSLIDDTTQEFTITGTKGRIVIPKFWCSDKMTLTLQNGIPQEFNFPIEATGFNYEIEEMNRCLREGKTHSEHMTPDDTLRIMKCMDIIRKDWDMTYEADTEGKV
jgi:dihydrodiol dehydrogenase / D-xylose 1-dehydrogenase (NADP)